MDSPYAPVSGDLNGHIAVRTAREPASTAATELVLSRSRYFGTPVWFAIDRSLLTRALELGYAELEFVVPKNPIVGRSNSSTYGWQPLHSEAVVEPTVDVTRIEFPTNHSSSPPGPPSRIRETPGPNRLAIRSDRLGARQRWLAYPPPLA